MACALVLACAAFTNATEPAAAGPLRQSSGLKLSLIAPDPGSIGDRFALDVSFRGGAVQAIRLFLDGQLVAQRQLLAAQSRGVVTFTVDATLLTAGSHDVQVQATGPDGKTTGIEGTIKVPALDLNAPVRIAYPQNGIQVSGVVPVRVAVDPTLQKLKPYVTFFVDRELKVLKNYPPYEYNWDTTRVNNGWHMLEAWTATPDSASPLKARPVHVNVNNPTGETKRLDRIEDLRGSGAPIVMQPEKPGRPAVDPATAITGSGAPRADVTPRTPGRLPTAARPLGGSDIRTAEPSPLGYGTTSRATLPAPGVSARAPRLARPAARMTGGAVVQPAERMAVPSQPKSVLPSLGGPALVYPVITPQRTGADSLLKVQPGDTLKRVSRRTGIRQSELERLNNMSGTKPLRGGSVIAPGSGAFDVAFDGVRIAFDVQPRVEAGVRIAPFRQIFEHTGGRLYWHNEVKSVKAVNTSREIQMQIGNPSATVNNQTVTMERSPKLIGGRTVVPLSFIRDAMDVKVSFDERTGRILIRSVK